MINFIEDENLRRKLIKLNSDIQQQNGPLLEISYYFIKLESHWNIKIFSSFYLFWKEQKDLFSIIVPKVQIIIKYLFSLPSTARFKKSSLIFSLKVFNNCIYNIIYQKYRLMPSLKAHNFVQHISKLHLHATPSV